jgi:hypothetical protein
MTRKVVTTAEFGPPRLIGDDDFEAICRTSSIAAVEHSEVREFLDETIRAFAEMIVADRALPDRQADRLAIAGAIKALERAQDCLKRPVGRAGQFGLRVAGRAAAPTISGAWMRERFPDDPAKPHPVLWPPDDRSGRGPPWAMPERPIDADALSLSHRIAFMGQRAGAAIPALLDDIAAALDNGRRAIVLLPDGRKPLEHRACMLAGLAELWYRLGRQPTSGINSEFGAFAEGVFEAIGWPTEGVNAALPDAINLWHSRYRR